MPRTLPEPGLGIPAENRIALAQHEQGISLYRATGNGLRHDVSADGVVWRAESTAVGQTQKLWPLCSGETIEQTDLFCVDPLGRIRPTRSENHRIIAANALPAITNTTAWYEAPPEPHDLVIVKEHLNGPYRALFCARRRVGRHPERRGCIGTATSRDFRTWSMEPPLFAPNRYTKLFSPHVVMDPGRVILFYSTQEHGDVRAIRFALAPAAEGPYEHISPDVLCRDARSTLATILLGAQRLVFFSRSMPGELHLASVSRPGQLDLHPNGRPYVRFYDKLLRLLNAPLFETDAEVSSAETLVRLLQKHGSNVRFSATVRSDGARHAGLLIRANMTGHDNITLWLDFEGGSLSLRRGVDGRLLAQCRHELQPGVDYKVVMWAEGGFVDIYLDDSWVLTGPTESRRSGGFGFAVRGGRALFKTVRAEPIAGPRHVPVRANEDKGSQ